MKAYNEEHQELSLVENDAKCLMKIDANYWAGAHLSVKENNYFSLVECYKIVFELNRLECRDYFEFCNNNTRSNNPFKIRMKSAKVNTFKHSFFVRIIKEWDNLLHHLFGNDINIKTFKYNLKKWMNIS